MSIDVLSNDTDFNGEIDSSKTSILSQAKNGSSVFNQNSLKVDYLPNSTFSGMDTFTYHIFDNEGDSSNVATVIVAVNAEEINQKPVAKADSVEINSGDSVVILVLINDTDFDGQIDSTSITIEESPKNGNAQVLGNTVKYISNVGFDGIDSIYYSITDTSGEKSNFALIKIEVTSPLNQSPIAKNDASAGKSGELITVDVLNNDNDDNGLDSSSLSILSAANNGVINITNDFKLTYSSNENFEGVDSFQYSICDNSDPSLCDDAWVYVNIELEITNESAPVAQNDFAEVEQNGSVTFSVAENDSDSQNQLDLNSLTIISDPTKGNADLLNNGTLIYTPNQDSVGKDSFTYSICDNGSPVLCDSANVYINIYEISTNVNSENVVEINISPNPATDLVNIAADFEFNQVEIIDLLGNNSLFFKYFIHN
ncbi:MAG: hypothetical protein ACJATA_000346 [Sphingobacteriales bacterium]